MADQLPDNGPEVSYQLAQVSEATRAYRRAILRKVHQRRVEMADEMLGKIDGEISEYRALSRSVPGDVQRALRVMVAIALDSLTEMRPLSRAEVQTIMGIGRRRSDQGLELETLISAVGVAFNVGAKWIFGQAARVPASDEVLARKVIVGLVQDLMVLKDEIAKAFRAGYTANRGARSSGPSEPAAFLNELFRGAFDSNDDEEIVERAAAAGYDIRSPQRLIVLAGKSTNVRTLQRASLRFCAEVPTAIETLMEAEPNPHSILVVAAEVWTQALKVIKGVVTALPVTALLTREAEGPNQLLIAYHQARDVLRLALKTRGLHSVTEVDFLLPDWILEQVPANERLNRLLERVIGPLQRDPNCAFLLPILAAEIGGVPQKATVRELGISESTLRRYLKRIREATGIDLNDPEERFAIQLALRLSNLTTTGQKLTGARS